MIPRTRTGHRVGEHHHRARLSNEDVSLMRELYEEHGLGYMKLAQKFECGISTARDICKYRTR